MGNNSSIDEVSCDVKQLWERKMILMVLFVLGVIITIMLTAFVGTEVKRRPHIIVILADELGTILIHKCNSN